MAPSLWFVCNFNWLAAVVGASRGKLGCNEALTDLVLSQALGIEGDGYRSGKERMHGTRRLFRSAAVVLILAQVTVAAYQCHATRRQQASSMWVSSC
jgi:hypothetical protein